MKNYVLDTTVLLYDSQALQAFGDNHIIVPMEVIEDVDRFKKDLSETGRNARQVSRYLDTLRSRGRLSGGVRAEGGGHVSVRPASTRGMHLLPMERRNRKDFVLAVALELNETSSETVTVVVTKDINLRIRADALGLQVEDYESEKIDIEELYSGYSEIVVPEATIEELEERGRVSLQREFLPNEYVFMKTAEDSDRRATGRFIKSSGEVVRVRASARGDIWRVTPRNREQACAMDALVDDSIQLITLVGKAGTGKTLLAVAASLYKTVDENTFNRVLVSRPTQPLGKDIGFLPGGIEQKLFPWMYPIADNVEFLMRGERTSGKQRRGFRDLIDSGILIIEPLTYIRGRSIHDQYLIVDEAQNLTPHELKTIITRVGEGTKIVVTGDPYQIDNPYIDSSSNGLTYVVEKFKTREISAHITLTRGERSRVSELAANLL